MGKTPTVDQWVQHGRMGAGGGGGGGAGKGGKGGGGVEHAKSNIETSLLK